MRIKVLAIFLCIASVSAAQVPVTADMNMPVREIDDPSSGARWLMYGSENGGPGRLVLITVAQSARPFNAKVAPIQPLPVIRAGDRVVLEEHTAVVDAALEATALTPAARGKSLRVRLSIGGHMLAAVALAPGRAVMSAPEDPLP